jgi:hypothetical protein
MQIARVSTRPVGAVERTSGAKARGEDTRLSAGLKPRPIKTKTSIPSNGLELRAPKISELFRRRQNRATGSAELWRLIGGAVLCFEQDARGSINSVWRLILGRGALGAAANGMPIGRLALPGNHVNRDSRMGRLPYINNLYSLIGVGFRSFLIPVPYIRQGVTRFP